MILPILLILDYIKKQILKMKQGVSFKCNSNFPDITNLLVLANFSFILKNDRKFKR